MQDKLLTSTQVAELLNVSPDTVFRWKREGRLPKALQLGPRATRWRESDIQKFIEQLEAA